MLLKYEHHFCSVLLRPITSSTEAWRKGSKEIQGLADCFDSYSNYLKRKNEEMQTTHAEMHPARTIAEDATIEHRTPSSLVKQQCNTTCWMLS